MDTSGDLDSMGQLCAVLGDSAVSLLLRYDDATQTGGNTLAVIGFGVDRPATLPAEIPFASVGLPWLGGAGPYEVWSTDRPVEYYNKNGVALASDGELLFGLFPVPDAETDPRGAAQDAYLRLFDAADHAGYADILRFWNYLPAITEIQDGMERYRRFNQGRQDAFTLRRPDLARPPAASALGSLSGVMLTAILASRQGGTPIENPRQISAYRYPSQYGPVSPTFSRALLARPGLFISGTASIRGHSSMHEGDVAAQTEETVTNLRALFQEAAKIGFAPALGALRLKVYIRHPVDKDAIARDVAAAFPDARDTIFLQADVCRPELLMEIEAMHTAG